MSTNTWETVTMTGASYNVSYKYPTTISGTPTTVETTIPYVYNWRTNFDPDCKDLQVGSTWNLGQSWPRPLHANETACISKQSNVTVSCCAELNGVLKFTFKCGVNVCKVAAEQTSEMLNCINRADTNAGGICHGSSGDTTSADPAASSYSHDHLIP